VLLVMLVQAKLEARKRGRPVASTRSRRGRRRGRETGATRRAAAADGGDQLRARATAPREVCGTRSSPGAARPATRRGHRRPLGRGDRRAWHGKEARCSQAWLAHREAAGGMVPHHFIRRGFANWDDPEALVGSLVAQIETQFPGGRAKPEADARAGPGGAAGGGAAAHLRARAGAAWRAAGGC